MGKKGVHRTRSNGGYSKASPLFKDQLSIMKNVDTSWMDRLPGGSWKDPGVLREYIKSKLR